MLNTQKIIDRYPLSLNLSRDLKRFILTQGAKHSKFSTQFDVVLSEDITRSIDPYYVYSVLVYCKLSERYFSGVVYDFITEDPCVDCVLTEVNYVGEET